MTRLPHASICCLLVAVVPLLAGCQAPSFYHISSRDSLPGTLNFEVYHYDEGVARRITTTDFIEEHPVYSPTNGRIYFSGYAPDSPAGIERQIFAYHVATGTLTQITSPSPGYESNSHVYVAPDERSLFVTSHRSDHTSVIRRIGLDGADLGVVIDQGAHVGHSPPATTPDGPMLYFSSDADGDYDVYRLSLNGAGAVPVNLTQNNGIYDSGAAPSEDGSRVAFTRQDPSNPCVTQIFVMNHDGGGATQVTTGPSGFKWAFGWHDGKILYATNESGSQEIRAIAPDGSGEETLVASSGDDMHLLPDALCGFPGPEPELEGTPLTGPPGTSVALTLSGDTSSFVKYHWKFGDGAQAETTAPTTTHVYAAPGSYKVSVTTEDQCGPPPNKRVFDLPLVKIEDGERTPWDFDDDGEPDLIETDRGLGYDVGGNFVEVRAEGYAVIQRADGFDVKLDTDGDGTTDEVLRLRDKNGDGDFGEPGEVERGTHRH